MVNFKTSVKIKIVAIPGKDPELGDKLVFSQRTGKLIRLSESYISLLFKNQFINMPGQLIQILARNELIVPDFENEVTEILYKQSVYQLENEKFDTLQLEQIEDHHILAIAEKLKLI